MNDAENAQEQPPSEGSVPPPPPPPPTPTPAESAPQSAVVATTPPAAPASAGDPAPRNGLSKGALIGIIGGAVAIIAIIATVIGLVVVPLVSRDPAGDASALVEGYLTAIADGDSETALSYLSDVPIDDSLLTDAVLAASSELAPLSDIEVVDVLVSGSSATVNVTYLLGDAPITTQYDLFDYDRDNVWELPRGLADLDVGAFRGLGLTVNGAETDADSFSVFPGTYELATTLENFALTGETTVTVTEGFAYIDSSTVKATLSEAALAEFRSLVRAAVEACVASTALAAGCGLDLPATLSDGTQMADGTIQRSLSADTNATLDSLEVTLSYNNPTLAQGEYIGSVSVSGQCTKGGASGTCEVLFGPSLGRPSIDMAVDSPTVIWD